MYTKCVMSYELITFMEVARLHIFIKTIFYFAEEPLEFTKPLASIEVTEGQSIFLECTISKPGLTPTWYKNGVKVTASETITLTSDGNNHSLTIDRAQLTDQAEYTVKVDGKSSKAEVKVIGKSCLYSRQSSSRHHHHHNYRPHPRGHHYCHHHHHDHYLQVSS